jgi:haloalkane dehalogenase
MSEVYRTPDERFTDLAGYNYTPNYLELEGEFQGLRLHYVDEGEGSPVVLLHGEPTWAYLYRKMIPALSGAHRVLAPDFIGFGRSDKVTERDWYSYDRHAASLHMFVDALDIRGATLVVQDWGGPIGLRVAMEQPDRFERLVLLNTGLFRPSKNWPNPAFLAWRAFAEKNPDLPVGFIIQGATSSELSPEVIAGYEAPFPSAASKAGVAAFPLLVPLTAEEPAAHQMGMVDEALESWRGRVLVAFSDQDPIFSAAAGERWASRLPDASSVTIEGASHFLQEDKGESIAEHILKFLAG